MTYESFMQSVEQGDGPSSGTDPRLAALWFAAKGDWDQAHQAAQGIETPDGSWIHAHLHRQEGDLANARYWYARARKDPAKESLDEERNRLIRAFVDASA